MEWGLRADTPPSTFLYELYSAFVRDLFCPSDRWRGVQTKRRERNVYHDGTCTSGAPNTHGYYAH